MHSHRKNIGMNLDLQVPCSSLPRPGETPMPWDPWVNGDQARESFNRED